MDVKVDKSSYNFLTKAS